MSNLFYKTDSKNNTGVGTNIIEAQTVGLTLDFSKIGENNGVIKMNDNLSNALNITEGNNSYIQFKTKNNEEQIVISKNVNITGTSILDVTGDTSVSTFDSSSTTSLATGGGVTTIGHATTTPTTISAAGIVNVTNATNATSTSTGSIQTAGGLSVTRDVFIGDELKVTGVTTVSDHIKIPTNKAIKLGNSYTGTIEHHGSKLEIKENLQ